jgi:mannose/cellobiose epimerase-like protein (N-acyl-D-glucosamine 2-epimerase family)
LHVSDHAWVGDFLDRVLALWRRHADTPNGLFDPYLDREWRHNRDGPRTLVSQCRLIYVFSRAYERSGDQAYAELAHCGIDALLKYFRGADDDGFAWACRGDGSVDVDTFDAYGHAFVILALATAATVFQDPRYRDLAWQTWAFMQRRFRDQHGGLIWHIARDGRILDDVRSQNPLMHTFEALLVLAPLDERGTVRQDAARIWDFLRARMLGPGCLPEWYDPDWRPVAEGERAVVEVGHAFEWAFLLSEAQELFPEDDLLLPGREFLAYGMRYGYDAAAGGIFSQVEYDGRRRGQRKGWWEQCEAIRAMQRYVARHGAAEIAEPLRQSVAFAREHFVDDEYGGWYLNPPAAGGEPSLDKGNAYKLDYHVVNMGRELLA